ncbi:MAG TPA: hypothetical protein VEK06_01180 [Myxococcota bacterium]|nr:hypothetical protein [Myxococcota bacterium]
MLSPWYRLALSVLLLAAMVWLWSGRFSELRYHTWQNEELVDIGDARQFEEKRQQILPNSYVSVSGILGNKAASLSGLRAGSFRFGRYQIRHLLGSKLYVEYNEAKYHEKFSPFTRIDVKGRLVSFGPNSEMSKVRDFFEKYYHQPIDDSAMLIVVDETPRSEMIYALVFIVSIIIILYSFYSSIKGLTKAKKDLG